MNSYHLAQLSAEITDILVYSGEWNIPVLAENINIDLEDGILPTYKYSFALPDDIPLVLLK